MRKNRRSQLRLILAVALILAASFPSNAYAQSESFSFTACYGAVPGITAALVTCSVYWIAYVAATIMAFFVAIGAWLINVALRLNQTALNSPAVKSGFGVTLAVANLGFVLAIIIIAIATILRIQSYGLKQTLWKLVTAALLVNFSLVIAGAIFNFSNQLAFYFVRGAVGDISAGTPIDNSNSAFVNRLTAGFAPQSLFKPPDLQTVSQRLSSYFVLFLNVIFIVVFMALIAIAMIATAIMIIIRYVAISILLILMPMAWMLWILPGLSGNWSKWWSSFWRWCFFAPVTLFFLYLAVLTVSNKGSYVSELVSGSGVQPQANSPQAAEASNALQDLIQRNAGNEQEGFFAQTVQMVVALALVYGGLVAANKLSITGAGMAMGAAKGAGKWAAGAAWKGTKGTGRFAARKGFYERGYGQKAVSRLQQSGLKPLRVLGRGLDTLRTGARQRDLAAAKEKFKGKSHEWLSDNMGSFNAAQRMAALSVLKEAKRGDLLSKNSKYFAKDREQEFQRYGAGRLHNELYNESALKLQDLNSDLKTAKAGGNAKAITDAEANIKKYFQALSNPGELGSFFGDLKQMEIDGKIPLGLDKKSAEEMQQSIVKGIAQGFSPQNASAFFQGLIKGGQVDSFETTATDMKNKGSLVKGDIGQALDRWLNGNGAANLGVGVQTFGF